MTEFRVKITWKTITSGIIAIFTLIGMLVGAVYAADGRYIDVTELNVVKAQFSVAQAQFVSDINSMQYNLNKQRIEDRIQDYRDDANYIQDKIVDGTATPTDRKRLNRYNNSIQGLQRDLDRLGH